MINILLLFLNDRFILNTSWSIVDRQNLQYCYKTLNHALIIPSFGTLKTSNTYISSKKDVIKKCKKKLKN